jgi:hypothetical protein
MSTSAAADTAALNLVVETLSADPPSVQNVLQNAIPHLRAGDSVLVYHLVRGTPINVPKINQVGAELEPHLPAGVDLVVGSGLIRNVQLLADGMSTSFSGISATYEPGGATGGGDYSVTALLDYFKQVASIARGAGRTAIAYPTGHPLLRLPAAKWDYGAIAELVDLVQVETQEYAISAISDPAIWESALEKLTSQFAAHSQPLSKLAVQVTLGDDNHGTGTTPQVAIAAAKAAQAKGIPSLYVWTAIGAEAQLRSLLVELGR